MIIKHTCDDVRNCERFIGPYRSRCLSWDYNHDFPHDHRQDFLCDFEDDFDFHDDFGFEEDSDWMNYEKFGCCGCDGFEAWKESEPCGCKITSCDLQEPIDEQKLAVTADPIRNTDEEETTDISEIIDVSKDKDAGGTITAYGGGYNHEPTILSLMINTFHQLPLPQAMAHLHIANTPADSLTIEESGIYEINYMFRASASLGAQVTLSVRQNGISIPGLEEVRQLTIGDESTFFGSVIFPLHAQDVIDIGVSALLALTLTTDTGTSVTLSLKKLAK